MSVGADKVFNVSDPHPVAFPARESNTDWPRYSTVALGGECASESGRDGGGTPKGEKKSAQERLRDTYDGFDSSESRIPAPED